MRMFWVVTSDMKASPISTCMLFFLLVWLVTKLVVQFVVSVPSIYIMPLLPSASSSSSSSSHAARLKLDFYPYFFPFSINSTPVRTTPIAAPV
jgi:hypothetical protein